MSTRTAPSDRFVRRLGTTAAFVAALLLTGVVVAGGVLAASSESISRYETKIEVRDDGTMRVTETIGYDFGTHQRHGITRNVPARSHYDNRRDRIEPISDVTVTVDGSPEDVTRSSGGGYEKFRIGNPGRTITGAHVYTIRYTVRGALNSFADHEELYWNAVGAEWSVPIAAASATITGPSRITQVQCFTGPSGSHSTCAAASTDGSTATFRQASLAAGSGLTTVVAFPKGSVRGTEPILVERRDLAAAFTVSRATVSAGIGIGIVAIACALGAAWLVGRDRRYRDPLAGRTPEPGEPAEKRTAITGGEPTGPEFAPPDGLRPGQVGTLVDERANVVDVTATIIDFAVRRHLSIAEISTGLERSSPDWRLTKLTDGDPHFLPYERTLFTALFGGRHTVLLSDLKGTFAAGLTTARRDLYKDVVAQGWYRASPRRTRAIAWVVAASVLLLSILVTVLLGLFAHAALAGLGLVAGAVALLAVAGKMPARTGRGTEMVDRVRAFRQYLATADADKIDLREQERVFSQYLPYAMVFGFADRWAGLFAGLDTKRSDGSAGLYWYAGYSGWSMHHFHQSIGQFTTTTSGTIAATPPSSSGSSGFSSGGFSGGGGGGGGGGSW